MTWCTASPRLADAEDENTTQDLNIKGKGRTVTY